MSNTDQKILKLIESKSFAELTDDEKSYVLEHLSESEYGLQRTIQFTSRELMEEEGEFLTPDARIASNLKAAMRERKPSTSLLDQLIAFVARPVPAYQLALGIVLLAILFVWGRPEESTEIVYKDKIVYQEKYYTVYIEQPVIEVQTVEKVVKVVEYVVKDKQQDFTSPKFNRGTYQSEKDRMEAAAAKTNSFAFTEEQIEIHKQKSFGNTSVDVKELTRFIGVLN